MTKRAMSIVLALILLVGCFATVAVSAEETSYNATLGYANSDWSAQSWDQATTVTGAGDYSITFEGAGSDALVLVVDIQGAAEAVKTASLKLTALSVLVDGNEVPVDLSKVIMGDLENKGNVRIEIYNEYGATKADPGIDPAAVSFASNLTVNFTLAEGENYVAGMGLVASDWSTSTDFREASSVQTSVSGNGAYDYTMTYEGACADLGILVVDVVGAQAALDAENKTFAVSNVALTIDGEAVAIDESKILVGDLESNGNFRIDLYNMYGDSKDDPCLDNTLAVNESLVLSFTLTPVVKAEEEEVAAAELPTEFNAFIAFGGDKETEGDWGWQYYGADAEGVTAVTETIQVGEAKTISLTFDSACVNAWFFAPCLVADGVSAIGELDFDITCAINGEEVAIDMAADANGKVWWLEDTGDYAGNCLRLAGGFNEWATQYIAEPESVTTIEYTITLNNVAAASAGAEEEAEEVVELVFDADGTYNAYLLLQTPNWTYRDAWNTTNGIDSEHWGDALYGNETNEWYGKITDAVLAGNGTYTIEITDFGYIFEDDFAAAGQDYFNIIGVSTDVPLGGLTFTDVKLIVDGSTRHTYAEGYQDPDTTDYAKILIQNKWNDEVAEISYYPAPTTSLQIEFTVSGFSYDKAVEAVADEPAVEDEPVVEEPADEAADDNSSSTGVIIAVVAVVVVAAAVVAVVLKKKKK